MPNTVPHDLYPLLNVTTAALFARDQYMLNFVAKTFQVGIQYLGSLVQMTEDEIFRLAPTTDANRKKLRSELRQRGLGFGMVAPGWVNPSIEDMKNLQREIRRVERAQAQGA